MGVSSYEELEVWQRAMDFAVECCRLSKMFPGDERFELASQLKRSSVSVPSNIAEGQQRIGRAEFLQALGIARGSLAEALTQLRIAFRLGYITTDEQARLLSDGARIGRMLNGLMTRLVQRSRHQPPVTSHWPATE